MATLGTTSTSTLTERREVRSKVAIHVQHDTKSNRASKVRRVLLRNTFSTEFNNRWRELFAGDIVTKESVWPKAIHSASASIYSGRERLPQHQSPLRTDQLLMFKHRFKTCITTVACNCWPTKDNFSYLRPKQFSCGQFEVSDISDIVSFPPYMVKSIKFY